MTVAADCPLCTGAGGLPIVETGGWRVVRVEDESFPAYYRVICASHATAFDGLPLDVRNRGMEIVFILDQVLNAQLQPVRVNIASLGNMVAHLHWHVTARFGWDSHFPQSIWGPVQRAVSAPPVSLLPVSLEVLDCAVRDALTA